MKILMVCLGNICRSPLAHGILQHKAEQLGLDIQVDSAGTSAYHIGELPDPRSIEIAEKNGIDINYQRARQFVKEDFQEFDYIFAMDASNYNNICNLATSDEQRSKVLLMLNESHPKENRQVPDPYYGGAKGFQNVYDMLNEAIDHLIARLT